MSTGIINGIEITDLFGQFTYRIPPDLQLSNPSILYGDNGIGKKYDLSDWCSTSCLQQGMGDTDLRYEPLHLPLSSCT